MGDSEGLKILHKRILSSIDQFGKNADAAAERPAMLMRQIAALQEEREREREEMENQRMQVELAGQTAEEQLVSAKREIEKLRTQASKSEAGRDAALRDLEKSSEQQRRLQLDLDAANSELQMLRLELNLLRPYEVPPLPSAAAQLEHPELEPPPSPRVGSLHGAPLKPRTPGRPRPDSELGPKPASLLSSPRGRPVTANQPPPGNPQPSPRPGASSRQRPSTALTGAATLALPDMGLPAEPPPWHQQMHGLQKANTRMDGVLAGAHAPVALRPASVRGIATPTRDTPRTMRKKGDPLVAILSSST